VNAPERQFVLTTNDAFVSIHDEPLGELESRIPDLLELLEEGLTVAIDTRFRYVRAQGG
jgi:hypothetical protein